MNKWKTALFAAASIISSGFAEEESGAKGYIGVKGGPLLFSQGFDYEDAVNMGLLGGFRISPVWAVEAEFTTSVSDADGTGANLGELNVFTLGVYGVFRSQGTLYFKGKAGILYEFLDADWNGFPLQGEGIGISLGLGGGWRITDCLSTEVEFQTIEADISMLSLGVLYWF